MRLRAFLWLLMAVGLALALCVQFSGPLPLQTNLLTLLPATERNPMAEKAVERLTEAIGNRAVFLVGGASSEEAAEAARRFAASLRQSGAFRQVIAEIPPFDAHLLSRFYHPYRFYLLDEATRTDLAENPALAARLQRTLHSPFRFGPRLPLADDPLGLSAAWLESLPLKTWRLEPENGLLVVRENARVWVFVTADPGSAYDNAVQRQVANAVENAETGLRAASPNLEVLRTGAVFYAEAARRSAERDFDFIAAGSLAGLLLMLYLVFRSLRPLVLGFLSIAFGIAMAVFVTVAVYGELHLITLVFGASLTGEAIDYSIQYFAAHLGAGPTWEPMAGLRRIAPGLGMAFIASVSSYLALVLVPFPVFSQIALFALCGLGGACLTVFLLLPVWLTQASRRDPEKAVALPRRALAFWKAHVGPRNALWLCAALIALALPGILRLQGNDEIRLLIDRPASLQAQEARIRELTGVSNSSQFFLVEGADAEEVLRREEALGVALTGLIAEGALDGFTGISAFVPSQARQKQNRALWHKAVFEDEAALKHLFSEAGLRDEVAERLIRDFQESGDFLMPDTWWASPLSMPFRHHWLGDGSMASIVLLRGVRDVSRLAALDGQSGASFVDKAGSVSRLFQDYRQGGTRWLPGAILIIDLVLSLRYGFVMAGIILLPALLAIVIVLGTFGYLALPFTLFNLTALMLVLGVGVNYTVFLREGGDNSAATLLGVLLSAGTTLLSFGLLAFSGMPALSGFGLTLLLGVAAAMMLTPLVLSFSREVS